MKLFEEMDENDETINDAIQRMVNDMFQEELDDDVVDDIINNLSLSDIIELDTAYTNGDKEAVQNILGPLPQLEYSMGGRHPTSAASARPVPRAAQAQPNAPQQGQATSQGTANKRYSGVTDDEEEPVEEAGAPDYNPAKGAYARANEDYTEYGIIHYPDTSISYIVRRPYDDWEHIYDPSYGYDGPVSDEDLELASPIDAGKIPKRLLSDNSVIEMTEWLKKKAGIK